MVQLGRLRVSLLAGLALTLPGLLGASALGTLDITGLGPVRVTAQTIDFSPLGGGVGAVSVTGASEGFAAVPLLSLGAIADLTSPPATAGTPLAVPISPFLIVSDPGTMFSFSLEQIQLGVGPPCTVPPGEGSSCSPTELVPDTAFLLTQAAGGVVLEINFRGTVFDLSDSSSASYFGLITANTTGAGTDTISEFLLALGPGGPGFVELSWSVGLTSTGAFPCADIPEPATLTLIGAGVVALGGAGRRRRSRS